MRDAARPRIVRDAVGDRVLDDRLQHQRGNARAQRVGVGVDVDGQPIGEADALDLEIALDELQLVGERPSWPRASSRHERRMSLRSPTTRTTAAWSPFIASTETAFSVLKSTCGLSWARSPASRASASLRLQRRRLPLALARLGVVAQARAWRRR